MAVVATIVASAPRTAHAEQFDLQIALEPGVASLHESQVTNWGLLGGGLSAAFSLNDRLSVIALYDRSQFTQRDPSLAPTTPSSSPEIAQITTSRTPNRTTET